MMNKKILLMLSLAVFMTALILTTPVKATDVNIDVEDGEVATSIVDGDVTYESIVDSSRWVDLTHVVIIDESFTVVDQWDGYFGSIDIDTTFDSPLAHVEDNLYVWAFSQDGQQVASSSSNTLSLDRGLEFGGGYLDINTEYESMPAGGSWHGSYETNLVVLAVSGELLQEQLFTNYKAGTWASDDDMVLDVDGAYYIGYEIIDLRGEDSSSTDYIFDFEASDWSWRADAIFMLDESYINAGRTDGSGKLPAEDGFHIDMTYWGNSNPDVSFYAYGFNDLDSTIGTVVDGDEVTMAGTVDGE